MGRVSDVETIEAKIKALKRNIKRFESTAKTYKEKADRNYAYYKNGGRPDPNNNGEPDPNTKQECYLISQTAYAAAKRAQESAERYKRELEKLLSS